MDPEGTKTDEIHVTTAAGDKVLATVPDRSQGRCGSREDSNQGGYTASGSHLYVLNQPSPLFNSLVVFEGDQAKLSMLAPDSDWRDGAFPAMAVWSPTSSTLYFRQSADIWRWTPGKGKQRFLPGISWYSPTISADGAHLAYEADRAGGGIDVHLLDLRGESGPVRVGPGGSSPVFLDATRLWYQRAGAAGGCEGSSEPTEVIRDIVTGSEVATDASAILAVWPSTSANR